MKTRILCFLAIFSSLLTPSFLTAQGTAFVYQGQLMSGSGPANGIYNLVFSLYVTNMDGSAIAGPVTNNGVAVTNGLFTASIDFGSCPWNGQTNWLQINVETNGAASFTSLNPRQEITPAPYAIYSENAGGVSGLVVQQNTNGAPNLIGGSSLNNVSVGVIGATIGGGGSIADSAPNSVTGNFGTAGGGEGNTAGFYATVGGGDGNNASGEGSVVAGGIFNNASAYAATVGGGIFNVASGGGSFVGGGGYDGNSYQGNQAIGNASFVGGGLGNIASNLYSTVVAGCSNNATGIGAFIGGGGYDGSTYSGNQNAGNASAIAGGLGNLINSGANYSAIVGGQASIVDVNSYDSAIGGGQFNWIGAYTDHSFIGGGSDNSMLIPNGGTANTIGGGENNNFGSEAANGAYISDSVITGGNGNQVENSSSSVGGGYANTSAGYASTIGGGEYNTVIGENGTVGGGDENQATNNYSTVGGGIDNVASGQSATVAGGGEGFIVADFDKIIPAVGSSDLGNTAAGDYSSIGGGSDNTASGTGSTIAGGNGNSANNFYSVIGGGQDNTVNGYTSVSGGGYDNTAGADYSTVSGGESDFADGNNGTVAGGYNNTTYGYADALGGGQNNYSGGGNVSTIAGGEENNSVGSDASIGGGMGNSVSNYYSTISGGYYNTSGGYASTVAGGANNSALGDYSFAAGDNAQATNNNSFVWSDGSTNTISTTNNEFVARANGGFVFLTSTDTVTGVMLCPGSTSWATLSDRNAKKDFAPVNGQAVLEKLAAVPIEQWHYKWEADSGAPNLGPMAQDFIHAFYPGRDDKRITTLEFDGVELAAIQGLNQKLEVQAKEKDAEIAGLKQQNDSLARQLSELASAVKSIQEREQDTK